MSISDKINNAVKKGQEVTEKTKRRLEKIAADHPKEVGAIKVTASAACNGATHYWKGLRGCAISTDTIKGLKEDIENQGSSLRELNTKVKIKYQKSDAFFLAGDLVLASNIPHSFPEEIEEAYRNAYPHLAQEASLSDEVNHLHGDDLQGLISGIKGKLFEQKYVEYLNDGKLPDGYVAHLAESATQPGWDISIAGPDGHISDLIQAKATASVDYISDALARYPNIDIVTTDEVYSQLALHGISQDVINSGTSNDDLYNMVNGSITHEDISMSFSLPLLTMAMIAFTSYRKESLSLYEKSQYFGQRCGNAYMAFLLGHGVAAVTNTWWLGTVASISSKMIAEPGYRKIELYNRLKQMKATNRVIINRVKAYT
jgi:hypothetical protein